MSAALAPGFAAPVTDAQAVFRAALDALARPGRPVPLPAAGLVPPAPLTPELAALALALADADAPLWLDAKLAGSAAITGYLRFHTGARLVADPEEAAFALISDAAATPAFDTFAQGTDQYPDRSTTLILAIDGFAASGITLEGPGIQGTVAFGAHPVPADIVAHLAANRTLFPCGIDLLLAGSGQVLGIPRSSSPVEPA
jgi:alpha-D-ribose 1-methylphosphonate 5-triphosphate synthase subunit PhnH